MHIYVYLYTYVYAFNFLLHYILSNQAWGEGAGAGLGPGATFFGLRGFGCSGVVRKSRHTVLSAFRQRVFGALVLQIWEILGQEGALAVSRLIEH